MCIFVEQSCKAKKRGLFSTCLKSFINNRQSLLSNACFWGWFSYRCSLQWYFRCMRLPNNKAMLKKSDSSQFPVSPKQPLLDCGAFNSVFKLGFTLIRGPDHSFLHHSNLWTWNLSNFEPQSYSPPMQGYLEMVLDMFCAPGQLYVCGKALWAGAEQARLHSSQRGSISASGSSAVAPKLCRGVCLVLAAVSFSKNFLQGLDEIKLAEHHDLVFLQWHLRMSLVLFGNSEENEIQGKGS